MFRRKQGFTLIELLVVIAIIAVLAAILFPVFLMARAKAREMGCLANLKQLGGSFAMYVSDWGVFPFTAVPLQVDMWRGFTVRTLPWSGPTHWRKSELWTAKLSGYLGYELIHMPGPTESPALFPPSPQGVLRCRELDKEWVVNPVTGQVRVPNWTSWVSLRGRKDEVAYGYNFLYLGQPYNSYDTETSNPFLGSYPYTVVSQTFPRGAVRQGSIKDSAQVICLVENATVWAFPPWQGTSPASLSTPVEGNLYVRPRHVGGRRSNVLWADFHAGSIDTVLLVWQGGQFGDYRTGINPAQQIRYIGVHPSGQNKYWDTRIGFVE